MVVSSSTYSVLLVGPLVQLGSALASMMLAPKRAKSTRCDIRILFSARRGSFSVKKQRYSSSARLEQGLHFRFVTALA